MTTRKGEARTGETGIGDVCGRSSGQGRARASNLVMLALSVGALGMPGCRQAPPANTPAVIIDGNAGPDPAAANLAPADASYAAPIRTAAPNRQPVRVLGAQSQYAPQQSAESYAGGGQAQPAYNGQPGPGGQLVPPPPSGSYDTAYDGSSDLGVNAGYQALEEATQPPPALPQYEQPPAPEPNTIWTPGSWSYANAGYFWVPGAWVAAPYAGALWTPGYWGGYGGNRYRFHHGFWARHIGFYGGVNYGCGYTGSGYEGGYWRGNDFFYNRTVNRVNITNIHNVYERNITINNITRVSYNGGNGGLQARPRPQEIAVLREQRIPAMASQVQIRQEAAQNRQQFYAENHGRPAVLVASRPVPAALDFHGPAGQAPGSGQPVQPQDLRTQQQRIGQEAARGQGVRDLPGHGNALTQPQAQQELARQQQVQQQQHGVLQQQQQQEQAAREQNQRQQEAQRGGLQQQQRVLQPQQPAVEQQHRTQPQQPGAANDQQRAQQQRAQQQAEQQQAQQRAQQQVQQQQQGQQQRLQQQQAEAQRQQESARSQHGNERQPAVQPRAAAPAPPVRSAPAARPPAPPAAPPPQQRAAPAPQAPAQQPQAQQPRGNEGHPR